MSNPYRPDMTQIEAWRQQQAQIQQAQAQAQMQQMQAQQQAAFRQMLAEAVRDGTVAALQSAQAQQEQANRAGPTDYGVGYSGSSGQVPIGTEGRSVSVLRVENEPLKRLGCVGMASVQVSVSDFPGQALAVRGNQRLLLDVRWQTGVGGGEATVDACQGAAFTIGGTTSVEISARIEAANANAFNLLVPKRVEATVHWGTGINPKAAYCTLRGVTLAPGVPSAFDRIPTQSESMMALLSDTTAVGIGGLIAEFSGSAAAADIQYAVVNPFLNGCPIVAGVEFVRFTCPAATRVIPTFCLWL